MPWGSAATNPASLSTFKCFDTWGTGGPLQLEPQRPELADLPTGACSDQLGETGRARRARTGSLSSPGRSAPGDRLRHGRRATTDR